MKLKKAVLFALFCLLNLSVFFAQYSNLKFENLDPFKGLSNLKIVGSTALGCQEKGFSLNSGGIIEKSKGDALYGSLITFIDKNIKNCKVDLALIDTVSQYKVTRLAEINGSNHHITIKNYPTYLEKLIVE